MDLTQTDLILWMSAYTVVKWTVGLWAFRRAKAYLANRRQTRAV